jgi:PIN domain nuclease of toxin-antitoxin system
MGPVKVLLDTHALLWAITGDRRLSLKARKAIASFSTVVYISAASAWEISIKVNAGKLPGAEGLVASFQKRMQELGFLALSITADHAIKAGALTGAHRDPFDRMLIAQSVLDNLALVSNERIFDSFGVKRIW